jgi:hypothetical protein
MTGQDLIVLEMALQQFGLGICLDGDDEFEAAGGCHRDGWTGDDLREILVAAVVERGNAKQKQQQPQPPPKQPPPQQQEVVIER